MNETANPSSLDSLLNFIVHPLVLAVFQLKDEGALLLISILQQINSVY
jgi:hypothetical protein